MIAETLRIYSMRNFRQEKSFRDHKPEPHGIKRSGDANLTVEPIFLSAVTIIALDLSAF